MTRDELRAWAETHARGVMSSSVALAVLDLFCELDARAPVPVAAPPVPDAPADAGFAYQTDWGRFSRRPRAVSGGE